MTPAEQAKALCEARGGNFRDEVEDHLLTGYVFAGPGYFLLGKVTEAPNGELGWFVWCGVGSAKKLLSLMPFPLPWIGYYRQGRGRADDSWIRTDRIVSLLA